MAMNKKEQLEFDSLRMTAAINRALRWSPERAIEPDVELPESHSGHSEGFLFIAHGAGRIEKAWSQRMSHGTGEFPEKDIHRSGTQGGRKLYASRVLALRAMRCEMEYQFAATLAKIDQQIEAEIVAIGAGR